MRLYLVAASLERTYLMDTSTRWLPAACCYSDLLVLDLGEILRTLYAASLADFITKLFELKQLKLHAEFDECFVQIDII